MILHHSDSESAGQIHLATIKTLHAVLISTYLGNSAGLYEETRILFKIVCAYQEIA